MTSKITTDEYFGGSGIPEASLVSAEIYGISPRSRSLSSGGRSRPAYYEVWVRVAECPSRVFFRTQAAGTVYEMNDKPIAW